MDVCVELAKNLTAQYWSTALYNVAQPLSEYLAHTGVLVSVCTEESCFDTSWDDESMDFWSGSWLQQGTTGPRIFQGSIGMVIDGKVAADDITCLYPLDAVTSIRSNAGCGPMDAPEEMGWFGRIRVFARAYWTKLRWFITTKWDDIPCTKFMYSFYTGESPPTDDDNDYDAFFEMPAMLDHGGTWGNMLGLGAKLVGRVLHHSCCFDDSVPDFQDETMLVYAGEEPWSPFQWNDNADMTKAIIREHPASDGIWNEIVMKNLTSKQDLKDRVQAIFYTDEQDSYQARAEAEEFGGIPLLKMDVSRPKALFACAPKVMVAADHRFRAEEPILWID